jgi:hypothetical protein
VKATGVIVRFLSVLDVALILLGVRMITLMQAQLRSDAKQGRYPADGVAELADVDFVYLYAGWKGPENGRCYRLNADREVGAEVRADTADDIEEILEQRAQRERPNQVVMLLFSDDGWYSAWDAQKLAAVEQTWRVKVIPVYNVRLSR